MGLGIVIVRSSDFKALTLVLICLRSACTSSQYSLLIPVKILALSFFLVRHMTVYWHGSSACLMQDLKNGKSTGLAIGLNFDLSQIGLYF